jgi:glycerate-2-kinase
LFKKLRNKKSRMVRMVEFLYDIWKNGETAEAMECRRDILEIAKAAINAVNPRDAVKKVLKIERENIWISNDKFSFEGGKVFLAGFGKASIPMAKGVCECLEPEEGIVITTENPEYFSQKVKVMQGTHPVPNEKNVRGADEVIKVAGEVSEKDILIVLISGGGSALLSKPKIPLEDLRMTTSLLLKSGCSITEINTVRKHLSWVAGGQLAKFSRGTIISLIISDVIGDSLDSIASGPTHPDSTTYGDAKEVLNKYKLWNEVPDSVRRILDDGVEGKIPETPKKEDWDWKRIHNYIIANNQLACSEGAKRANSLGYVTLWIPSAICGEAKEVGKKLISRVEAFDSGKIALISGGEPTVIVKGNGIGGRNQELVLGAVEYLSGKSIVLASVSTDGIDGISNAAGAIADGFTAKRAKQLNLNYEEFLERNDSYNFFKALDDLIISGPTHTNVMDIQIVVKYK